MLIEGPVPPGTPLVPLYTIFPPDVVWQDWPVFTDGLRQVAWHGRTVLVGSDGRVERLLSTDPRDFLDPRFQPGSRVPR
ncbi:MAG: YlzJ-like family protein [Bacillota bacterium]